MRGLAARENAGSLAPVSAPAPIKVPLLAAIAIVAGNMIGTGVFSSIGFQAGPLPSGFFILLLWLLGGVLAFCGAVNYAELTAAFPRSGGEYQMLSRVYHPGVGFVSGWLSMTVGFPAPIAAAALVFGDMVAAVAGGESAAVSRMAAAGVVILVTGAHLISVAFSGRFQWISTALKMLLVAVLAVCGFLLAEGKGGGFLPGAAEAALAADRTTWLVFFTSLIYVLYAYSGWNAACYIAGEIDRPERNVPRALLIGTAVVTVLYIAVNAAMFYATPAPALAASGNKAAFTASQFIFGDSGARIMAALIAFGLVSAISAMTWAGPRVTQQMGRDYPLLGFLARTSSGGIPVAAVILQSALVLLLIFTSDVEAIITRTTFLLEIVLLLTVWGVVHLRIRQPDLPRPYRAWGYPWTTILYLVMIAFTLAVILKERPEDTRWGLAILITGVAFYFLARSPQRR